MPHAQLQSEEKYKQMTETPIPKLILRLGYSHHCQYADYQRL